MSLIQLVSSLLVLVSFLSYYSETNGQNRKADVSDVYLGVLEHQQDSAWVRFVFKYREGDWVPLCTTYLTVYAPRSWSIIHHGKILGEVKSSVPVTVPIRSSGFGDSPRLNLYTIQSVPDTPHVGRLDTLFEGWLDRPVYRPLVGISGGSAPKQHQWEHCTLSIAERRSFVKYYRSIVGDRVETCAPNVEPSDSVIAFAYADTNILVKESYLIRPKTKIVSLQLDPRLNHCDGPPGEEFSTYWLGLDSTGHLFRLGGASSPTSEFENSAIVEVGDFAGDGNMEALLWREKYDEDGYVLIYDNLKSAASCSWHYH